MHQDHTSLCPEKDSVLPKDVCVSIERNTKSGKSVYDIQYPNGFIRPLCASKKEKADLYADYINKNHTKGKVAIHSDSGSLINGKHSGISACSAVVFLPDWHKVTSSQIFYGVQPSEGELYGILTGLRLGRMMGLHEQPTVFRSDCQTAIMQIEGASRCKVPCAMKIIQAIKHEASQYRTLEFEWIPRERNFEADALCSRTLRRYERDIISFTPTIKENMSNVLFFNS